MPPPVHLKGSSGVRSAEVIRYRELWGRAGYRADLGSIRLLTLAPKSSLGILLFVIAIVFHYQHLKCGVYGFISSASDSFILSKHPPISLH
jgi:hypothetical protein